MSLRSTTLPFAALLTIVAFAAGVSATRATASTGSAPTRPPLDAGLAHVQTVQGVLILDPPYIDADPASVSRKAWTSFAATSAGDRRAEVHYRIDWAMARRRYADALAALRKTKDKLSAKQYAQQLRDLTVQYAPVTRTLWVVNAARHTSTVVFFNTNPITRKPARAKYLEMGPNNGLPPGLDRSDSWRVWELATQLRGLMAVQQGVTVGSAVVDGQPAYQVRVPAGRGDPAWSATVDSMSGLAVAVRYSGGMKAGQVGFNPPFHVAKLVVNQLLPAGTFTVSPDYRVIPHRPGVPKVESMDMSPGSGATTYSPPAKLADVASPATLVPSRVPAGYKLSLVQRLVYGGYHWAVLTYRRGMSAFVMSSGPRLGNAYADASGPHESSRITAFDRQTWPPLGGFSYSAAGTIGSVAGGAFAGAPVTTSPLAVGFPTEMQTWTGTTEAGARGDLTREEILAVAGSLEPLRPGAWRRAATGGPALIAVIAAAVAFAAAAAAWVRARWRDGLAARPRLSTLTWPLVGLALVVAGTCFEWHALLHNGPAWGIRGWDEPLGRWVIAAALLAVVCAAWRQLAAVRGGPVGLKFLSILFAAAALAGVALALVYLPLVARFTVQPPGGTGDVTRESWLLRIVSSQYSPSATIGLYLSITGALMLLVGVVMLRRNSMPEPVAGAELSPADALHNPDTRPDLA